MDILLLEGKGNKKKQDKNAAKGLNKTLPSRSLGSAVATIPSYSYLIAQFKRIATRNNKSYLSMKDVMAVSAVFGVF